MKGAFFLLAATLLLAGRCALAQDAVPDAPPPTAPTNLPAGLTNVAPAPPTNPPAPATNPAPAPIVAPATAASIAAQQAAEERFQRMSADLEALQVENESLKTKLAALEEKLDEVRQQQTAAVARNASVQEDLKRLADSIAAVDKKREEDRQAISDEIRQSIASLEKTLAAAPAPAPIPVPVVAPQPKPQPNVQPPEQPDGYSYTVREGQNLSSILKAYNADFKSKGWKTITLKQAEDANPKVDWNRLSVGQKIIIPKPEAQ